jgi:hypothetical protein
VWHKKVNNHFDSFPGASTNPESEHAECEKYTNEKKGVIRVYAVLFVTLNVWGATPDNPPSMFVTVKVQSPSGAAPSTRLQWIVVEPVTVGLAQVMGS